MASPSSQWYLPCDLGRMLVQASLKQSKFQDQKVMLWLPVPKIWSNLEGASPWSFSLADLAVFLSCIPRLPTRLGAYVSVSLPLLPLFLPLSSSFLPLCFFISLWLPSAFDDMKEVVLQTGASVSHLCVLIVTCTPLAGLGPESSEQGPASRVEPRKTPQGFCWVLESKAQREREMEYEATTSAGYSEYTESLCLAV